MAHEDLSREQQVEGSTDRAFGLVFAGAFLLIAGWPLLHREKPRSVAQARTFAGEGRESGCIGHSVLLRRRSDRCVGAAHGEGPAAPEARFRRELILDTAQAARAST